MSLMTALGIIHLRVIVRGLSIFPDFFIRADSCPFVVSIRCRF